MKTITKSFLIAAFLFIGTCVNATSQFDSLQDAAREANIYLGQNMYHPDKGYQTFSFRDAFFIVDQKLYRQERFRTPQELGPITLSNDGQTYNCNFTNINALFGADEEAQIKINVDLRTTSRKKPLKIFINSMQSNILENAIFLKNYS